MSRAETRRTRPLPDFAREAAAYARGVALVAGCDEAGRGPWAGPVVAAAVILDPARVPPGLDDSKRLSPARREALYEEICTSAEVALAMAPPARIDRDNILRAGLWALAAAVRALPRRPALVLVDGRDGLALECETAPIIGGDGIVASIAAASIVAKVVRDRLMRNLCDAYPEYGFGAHKGYGTASHAEALARLGPCPHHRLSFAPVRDACVSADVA